MFQYSSITFTKQQQANIGDSRSVACFAGQVDPLSFDHKPTCPTETSRIIQAGGWVQFNRVNGNLALSRAFGDFVFKRNERRPAAEQIVIAYPDVQKRQLTDDLEFIVLACDGVWDVMTNEEVIEFIRRRIIYRMDPVLICEELITRCLAPDCQMGSGIGCDNMTVIVICYLNGTSYEEFCDRVTHNCPLGIPPPPSSISSMYFNFVLTNLFIVIVIIYISTMCVGMDGVKICFNHRMTDARDIICGDGGGAITGIPLDDHDSDNSSDTSSACSYEDIFPNQSIVESIGGRCHLHSTMCKKITVNRDEPTTSISSTPPSTLPPSSGLKITTTNTSSTSICNNSAKIEVDLLDDYHNAHMYQNSSSHHYHHHQQYQYHSQHHHQQSCPQHGSQQQWTSTTNSTFTTSTTSDATNTNNITQASQEESKITVESTGNPTEVEEVVDEDHKDL